MFDTMSTNVLGSDAAESGVTPPYSYDIDYSCRFTNGAGHYLNRSQSAGSQIIWTWNGWLKRGLKSTAMTVLSEGSANLVKSAFYMISSGRLYYDCYNSSIRDYVNWDGAVLDGSNWYNLHIQFDSSQATDTDRIKVWINGIQLSTYSETNFPALNDTTHSKIGSGNNHSIGYNTAGANNYFDGLMAAVHYINGTTYTVDEFGETNDGVFCPVEVSGLTYGTGGYHLAFETDTNLGNDSTGGTDFTENVIAADDQFTDTPTNNHCCLDPRQPLESGDPLIKQANTRMSMAGASNWKTAYGTLGVSSGKYYWCAKATVASAINIGVINNNILTSSYGQKVGYLDDGYGYQSDGNKVDTNTPAAYGDTFTDDDIIEVALDLDNGKIWFGKNGTWQDSGTAAYSGLSGTYLPHFSTYTTGDVWKVQFGAQSDTDFSGYTPPTGYSWLTCPNLPDPSTGAVSPATGVDVIKWTGDGTDDRAITGLEFSPNLVLIKSDTNAYSYGVFDSVRGPNAELILNTTAAESDPGPNGYLTSFDSGGFTVTSGASGIPRVNASAASYSALCLKESSQYGFDIVTYVGNGTTQAINHDLGGVPEMIWVKSVDHVNSWMAYHFGGPNTTNPEDYYTTVNAAAAFIDADVIWNDTAPTSTTFTVGSNVNVNTNAKNYVAYLWRSIPGLSKVFYFEGNSATDGPVINCGFRPAYIVSKDADAANQFYWSSIGFEPDNAFDTYMYYSSVTSTLAGSLWYAQANGFKVTNPTGVNSNTQVGIAFADQSLKWSNSR